MILKRLYTDGFGKFHDKSINFDPHMNIVYGKNEAGKSTLHALISSTLFGLEENQESSSDDLTYEKYQPWGNIETFNGSLCFEKDETVYRICRDFNDSEERIHIFDEAAEAELPYDEDTYNNILSNLTKTLYSNTLSITRPEISAGSEIIDELKRCIANLHATGNLSLDVSNAIAQLNQQKECQKAKLNLNTYSDYQEVCQDLLNLEQDLSNFPTKIYIDQLEDEQKELQTRIDDLDTKRQTLLPIVEKVKGILNHYKFTTESEIKDFEKKFELDYGQYSKYKKKADSKLAFTLEMLFFSLSILLVSASGYYYFQQIFFRSGTLALLALIINCFGCAFHFIRKRNKKHAANYAGILGDALEHLLEDRTISEESHQVLKGRLKEFRELRHKLVSSERLVRGQGEEIIDAQSRSQAVSEEMEKMLLLRGVMDEKLEMLQTFQIQKLKLEARMESDKKIQEEIQSITQAISTLEQLATQIHDSFGVYLNNSASRYITRFTNGIYTSIFVNENLEVFIDTGENLIPIDHISKGTAHQVYLALRLALIDFLWPKEEMPLILDDSFALFDDECLNYTLKFIHENYKGQIILFTCHNREEECLKTNHLEYSYIAL